MSNSRVKFFVIRFLEINFLQAQLRFRVLLDHMCYFHFVLLHKCAVHVIVEFSRFLLDRVWIAFSIGRYLFWRVKYNRLLVILTNESGNLVARHYQRSLDSSQNREKYGCFRLFSLAIRIEKNIIGRTFESKMLENLR